MKVTFIHAKKAIFSFVLLTTMGVVNVAHSAIPVIDPAAIAQAVQQVQNQVQQIQNMRQQLKAVTDNGNYASLLNDPNLRKQQKNQVLQSEQQKRSNMTGIERVKVAQAAQEAQMIVMMKHLDTRSSSMQNLVNQINRTQNTAQKQDLMNALQAEQAMIQIDLGKMQVMLQMGEQQRRLAEKQAVDEYRQSTNR